MAISDPSISRIACKVQEWRCLVLSCRYVLPVAILLAVFVDERSSASILHDLAPFVGNQIWVQCSKRQV